MSGIAGVLSMDEPSVDPGIVAAMLERLARRGPDGQGLWSQGSLALGHRMLRATPESIDEHLPLVKDEIVLTCDARIDNRIELIRRLRLRSASADSELILRAYQEWGVRCPEKLRGDFAFALWDTKKRCFFAARDRIGIKPLYYVLNSKTFGVASEISPLFEIPHVVKRPDVDSLNEFLDLTVVPADRTLYDGIRRLPPGHTLVLQYGRMRLDRYWAPNPQREMRRPSLSQHAEEFRDLFSEAVAAQMRTSSGAGCLLSGGLDSSSVLCVAADAAPASEAPAAFSMIFDSLACDEREFIQEVTRKTDVPSYAAAVDGAESSMLLQKYSSSCPDWPVRGFCPTAIWPLMELARKGGTRVMLTGHGGDHVVEGNLSSLTDLMRTGRVSELWRQLQPFRHSPEVWKEFVIKPLLPSRFKNLARWLLRAETTTLRESTLRQSTLRKRSNGALEGERGRVVPWTRNASHFAHQEALALSSPSTSLWLDGYWDVLGSLFGMEFRHPFFDSRLIEYLLTIPPEEKLWGGQTKVLLREGMDGILPEQVRNRAGKAEFSPLVEHQFKRLPSPAIRSLRLVQDGFVNQERLATLNGGSKRGQSNSISLWPVLCLDAWYEANFN